MYALLPTMSCSTVPCGVVRMRRMSYVSCMSPSPVEEAAPSVLRDSGTDFSSLMARDVSCIRLIACGSFGLVQSTDPVEPPAVVGAAALAVVAVGGGGA